MKPGFTVTFLQLKVLTTYSNVSYDLTKEFMAMVISGACVKTFKLLLYK